MSLLLDEVARATSRLAEAGVPSPRGDAEELAAWAHGVRRGELHTVSDGAFDAHFWAALARRVAREPLQHITGRAYFRYLELSVGPGVFVPRPETEVVVGWAIDALRAMDVATPIAVDLGTGSGAIALSLAQEVPRVRVFAAEIDERAYAWAERNVSDNPAGARVRLYRSDFAAVPRELRATVDLVISNPPYIPLSEWENVPTEVREYDPPPALWAGDDGLDAIRVVERTARRLLRPDGVIVVEHGDRQGLDVPRLFPERRGWRDAVVCRDLAGRDRFVTARMAP
ncbi:MAG: peptide chain release factor N(5)-glutamine methyltransferase [Streptosporangiaceae bacterium]